LKCCCVGNLRRIKVARTVTKTRYQATRRERRAVMLELRPNVASALLRMQARRAHTAVLLGSACLWPDAVWSVSPCQAVQACTHERHLEDATGLQGWLRQPARGDDFARWPRSVGGVFDTLPGNRLAHGENELLADAGAPVGAGEEMEPSRMLVRATPRGPAAWATQRPTPAWSRMACGAKTCGAGEAV
jgi:hypothetical protein